MHAVQASNVWSFVMQPRKTNATMQQVKKVEKIAFARVY